MKKATILTSFFISGIASLIYEGLWAKELSLVFGSTNHAMSTVLATFLSGLAIGSILGGIFAKKYDNIKLFGFIQLGIGLSAIAVHALIENFSPVFAFLYFSTKGMPFLFLTLQFVTLFFLMLIPTIFMGMTFPVAISLYDVTQHESISEEVGKLYAVNTIGCVFGAVIAGFLTIPLLGFNTTQYIGSLCNFISAALVLNGLRSRGIMAACLLAASAVHFTIPPTDYFFNIYYASRTPSYEVFKQASRFFTVVWKKEDPEGTVVITKGNSNNVYGLTIRGKPEGNTPDTVQNPSPELMAYLLLAYRPEARDFMKIGLGTGETVMAAGKEPRLEKIDVIEINRAVIDAAHQFFFPELSKDPRIHFIVSDARKHLYLNDKKYDIISSQATDPTDSSSGFLFTKEYFEIVKSRLTRDGVFGMFLPIYLLKEKGSDIVVKTFASVFPYCYSWRIMGAPFLIASMKPLETSEQAVKERIELYSPGRTASLEFISGHEKLKEFARTSKAAINTDNRPIVEYIASRALLD